MRGNIFWNLVLQLEYLFVCVEPGYAPCNRVLVAPRNGSIGDVYQFELEDTRIIFLRHLRRENGIDAKPASDAKRIDIFVLEQENRILRRHTQTCRPRRV